MDGGLYIDSVGECYCLIPTPIKFQPPNLLGIYNPLHFPTLETANLILDLIRWNIPEYFNIDLITHPHVIGYPNYGIKIQSGSAELEVDAGLVANSYARHSADFAARLVLAELKQAGFEL